MSALNSFIVLRFDDSTSFVTKTHIRSKAQNFALPCSQLCRPKIGPKCRDFTLPSLSFISDHSHTRLRISHRGNKKSEQCFRVPNVSCLFEDSYGGHEEKAQSSSTEFQQEAVIDLKLPRRSLLVTFTCDACGARSQRLINRLAYERGLVYVQCSGCLQYHKLVDNLGLVIEHNLVDENDLDANADQV